MRTGDLVAASLVPVLFAGCGCSDPKAGTLPSASPSVTFTPTPTVSVTPDYEAEARQAVAAYFAALNAALRDPAHKTEALAALIAPSCTCRQVLELLKDEARQGRYLDYTYTVSELRVQQAGSLGASMTYVTAQSAGHERTADGRIVESFPASQARLSAHFQKEGGRWLLDRLDRLG